MASFLLATVATTLIDHRPPAIYFQTVAFLVPSFLVTLAIQGRFFRLQDLEAPPPALRDRHPAVARAWTAGQRVADVLLLVYLALGELAALYVLATGRASALLFGVTAGAVVTALIAIGAVALVGPSRAD